MSELLEVRDVSRTYVSRGVRIPVLRGVRFSISPGERVGLIGLSGAGKSTLARILLGLEKPDSGEVLLEGKGRFLSRVSPSSGGAGTTPGR